VRIFSITGGSRIVAMTLAESIWRLSTEIEGAESQIPRRALAGFRNVIVHGHLGVDLEAVWWSSNKTCQR
jgi:uncharacterized protein with HEPN domain